MDISALMITPNARSAKREPMPYDLQKPLAWVGADKADRLLISDVTRYGLHRKVVARKGELMDIEAWQQTVTSEAGKNEVEYWLVEIGEFYFLWMVWKEQG
jgi:hypothetical protein